MNKEKGKNNIKMILIGESGVGKTNLMNVAMNKDFDPNIASSNHSSFLEGKLLYKNKDYFYSLWDTAGQEMYRALNKIFIKGAKIIICVYAIDSKDSFEQLEYWINYAKETLEDDKYIMAILGNKSDLFEDQEVPEEDLENLAKKYNCKFIITSAMEDANGVKKFFNQLIIDYIDLVGPEADKILNFKLHESKKNEKGKKKKFC